jgi:hypothetical protein
MKLRVEASRAYDFPDAFATLLLSWMASNIISVLRAG